MLNDHEAVSIMKKKKLRSEQGVRMRESETFTPQNTEFINKVEMFCAFVVFFCVV